MKLNEKLVSLRKEQRLTQVKVAEELDVSRQAISRWELGVTVPSTENLRCISKLYNVPIDYLVNDESDCLVCCKENLENSDNGENRRKRKWVVWLICTFIVAIVAVIIGVIVAQREPKKVDFNEVQSEDWSDVSTDDIPMEW